MNLKYTIALLVLFLPSLLSAQDNENKPNIIFFITDDYGWQDSSEAMWTKRTKLNDRFKTPNMEKLADMGVTFPNAYSASCVCSASRISILTGQDPVNHGTTFITGINGKNSETMLSAEQDNEGIQKEDVLLPSLLQKAGYRTTCIGKAHFGSKGSFGADPLNLGFQHKYYADHNGTPRGENHGGRDAYHINKNGEQVHYSEAITRAAKSEIDTAVNNKTPFFLYVSHYAIHTPILTDPRFAKNYPNLSGQDLAYATLIEGADKSLGDIMDHLKKRGIAENTLIIWTADNGGLWDNKPLKGLKNDALEGGHRSPNFVAWGEQNNSLTHQKALPLVPGRIDNRPYIHQDWMPTLLKIAGTTHPNPSLLDGYDITNLLSDKKGDIRPDLFIWHEPNFWLHSGPESAIRENGWKLMYFYDSNTWELYNLNEDLGETKNLLHQHPDKAKSLAQKLISYLKENNANYPKDKKTQQNIKPTFPISS